MTVYKLVSEIRHSIPSGVAISHEDLTPTQLALIEKRLIAVERYDSLPLGPTVGVNRNNLTATEVSQSLDMCVSKFFKMRRRFHESGQDGISLLDRHSPGPRNKTFLDGNVERHIREQQAELVRSRPGILPAQLVREIADSLKLKGLVAPSNNTILARVKTMSPRENLRSRYGSKRAAETFNLVNKSSYSATRPLERVQIDHTLADAILLSSTSLTPIGRPWLTIVVDDYSTCVLSFVASWEPPNTTTVALALARAVVPSVQWTRRFGYDSENSIFGKPCALFLDNAMEFKSHALASGCIANGMNAPEFRPGGRPWWGGIVERCIGTAMTSLRLLPGNTPDVLKRRQFEIDPADRATMTIEEFERWFALQLDQYHAAPHPTLQRSRYAVWSRGIVDHPPDLITDPHRFFIDFLPRRFAGITRHGLVWSTIDYSDDRLQSYLDIGYKTRVEIRRSQMDVGRIFAKLPALAASDTHAPSPYTEIAAIDESLKGVQLWDYDRSRKSLSRLIAAESEGDHARGLEARSLQRELEAAADVRTRGQRALRAMERRAERRRHSQKALVSPHEYAAQDARPNEAEIVPAKAFSAAPVVPFDQSDW